MNEEVVINSIQSRESSFRKPRFLGVPRDDQLLESSSVQGILHGRTISEVHREDSESLERAGFSWERAGHVLNCLGAAVSYEAETQKISDRDAFYTSPHFKNIRAQNIPTRFQFDNPIRDAGIRADPATPIDRIAADIQEFSIHVENQEEGEFTTRINQLTVYLATAHHLLEKGNNYALTGEQLAILVEQFDEESFNGDEKMQSWIAEKSRVLEGPYKAIRRHQEKVKFIDGLEVSLKVMNYGSLAIEANSPELRLLQLRIDKATQELNSIRVISDRFNIRAEQRDGEWHMNYNAKLDSGDESDYDPVTESIPPESHLMNFIDIGTNIIGRAKVQSDGVLNDADAQAIHSLINQKLNLPDTRLR